ncbi:hypothetical protein [Bacillus sp. OTU530]|uniref:hypothetical protein n=1 Tax=Bacillus sp. OTU530 TaxID=3043862 RepID=UPI00313D542E
MCRQVGHKSHGGYIRICKGIPIPCLSKDETRVQSRFSTVRTSGTVSGNTNAAKQSSKDKKQVNPESVNQLETKQDVFIPLSQKEPQQEVKQQTFILITQTISGSGAKTSR